MLPSCNCGAAYMSSWAYEVLTFNESCDTWAELSHTHVNVQK